MHDLFMSVLYHRLIVYLENAFKVYEVNLECICTCLHSMNSTSCNTNLLVLYICQMYHGMFAQLYHKLQCSYVRTNMLWPHT